jgi:hypothetical protein
MNLKIYQTGYLAPKRTKLTKLLSFDLADKPPKQAFCSKRERVILPFDIAKLEFIRRFLKQSFIIPPEGEGLYST